MLIYLTDAFVPFSASTMPGPYARVPGQPPAPVIIPGVNDGIATAPPVVNNFAMPMNPVQIPMPMPMNPPFMGGGMGPPLPVPAPQHMGQQGVPLPPMPAFPQGPPPLPPLVGPPGQPPLPPLAAPPQQPSLPPQRPPLPPQQSSLPPLANQQGQSPPPLFGPQGQPPFLMQMPSVPPIVPHPRPLPGSMGNIPFSSYPSPSPPPKVLPQIGVAPKLPSWVIITAFVAFLGLIAEVDSLSKYAGSISTRYTGAGGGTIFQKAIVLAALAAAVGIIFFISYNLLIADFLTTVPWLLNLSHYTSNLVRRFLCHMHQSGHQCH